MISSRSDLHAYLAADCEAHGVARWRPSFRLTRRTLYFQFLLRRAEYWRNCRKDPLGRLFYLVLRLRLQLLGEKLGFSIPLNVIGPGLHLPHHGTIAVNGDSRVGARCTLLPGVSLAGAAGRAPEVGDDVFFGPNSVVLGVSIGNNVGVRAGTVVTRDLPDGVSAFGVPARIFGKHEPEADRAREGLAS